MVERRIYLSHMGTGHGWARVQRPPAPALDEGRTVGGKKMEEESLLHMSTLHSVLGPELVVDDRKTAQISNSADSLSLLLLSSLGMFP